ncbi:MAG: type II toxin-antitoxin system VapC family toxin [Thermodesulfobacteriota bacterium]
MYMLDTDICIYTVKKKPRQVLERLSMVEAGGICMSAITFAELMCGALKSREVEANLATLRRLGELIEVVSFDTRAAEAYGRVRSDLERRGQTIGSLDLLIAAHALACGFTLVTNNVGEFSRVQGLDVENWAR